MSLAIPRVAIHYERREAAPIGRRADWIVVAFAPSMAVGGTPRANPCEATGLCPGAANVRRARHRYRSQNSTKLRIPRLEPLRTLSLACRPGCSLAYFQPCRVRPGEFPGVPFEVSSSHRQAKTLSLYRRCIDLLSQALTFALNGITVRYQRCEMKTPTSVAELHNKLGAPSSETVESLRLLTAFLKLAPRQRFEVIALVERLATDPAAASDHSS